MQKLYHFTPRKNAASITTIGLRVSYAQTATPAIWLCGHRMLSWALAHIKAKYQLPREQIVCYQCRIPRTWTFKLHQGIWIAYRDIPIERLDMVTT